MGVQGEPRERLEVFTPERLVNTLKPYRDMGVGDFLLLARPPADMRSIELFATEVASALRD